jgi:hypothetical protein
MVVQGQRFLRAELPRILATPPNVLVHFLRALFVQPAWVELNQSKSRERHGLKSWSTSASVFWRVTNVTRLPVAEIVL